MMPRGSALTQQDTTSIRTNQVSGRGYVRRERLGEGGEDTFVVECCQSMDVFPTCFVGTPRKLQTGGESEPGYSRGSLRDTHGNKGVVVLPPSQV